MIRLLKFGITLALFWAMYWGVAAYGLRSGITGWFEAQQDRGWQADYAQISTGGFPVNHVTTLDSPALADPATGTAWQADWLTFTSPAIWPGQQTLSFADTPQRFSYFDQTAILDADEMQADLHLKPGVALELEHMTLTAGDWRITEDSGDVAEADNLTLSMVQYDPPEVYVFNARADAFTPGDGLRRITRSTDKLPRSFDTLVLDMTVAFDRPWDRTALEDSRPQPRAIALKLIEAQWGDLRLKAAGDLSIDESGVPTGAISLQAENWREMLSMAEAAGAIPAQAVDPAERVLSMMAGLGGNPATLDVRLNFRDGFVAVGPIPLGPAPRFILR